MTAAVQQATMQAIVRDHYGPASLVELRDMPRPEIAEGEVLVQVRAAGVDRGAWHIMTGLPYPIRLAGFGVRAPKNPVLGSEFAGVVERVGSGVTRFTAGDEVFGVAQGSFAQYAVASEDKLAAKPAGLTFEQAAAVPISGVTALQAVRDKGKVQAGQRVLVIGASGGVGTYAVQLAKAFGAEVTGVSSTAKVDLVRSLGADHVLDYTVDDFAAGPERYDVILDTGGNATIARLRRVLSPKGTLVIIGGETDGRLLGGTGRVIRAMAMSPFIGQTMGTFIGAQSSEDLAAMTELIDAGKVVPAIERSFPLSEAAAAITHVAEGRARGKVVITVA